MTPKELDELERLHSEWITAGHEMSATTEERRKVLESRLRIHAADLIADSRKLAAVLSTDNTWPLRDVLAKLIEAATHLLDDHCCDQHGYEQFRMARDRAAELLKIIDQPNPTPPEGRK